MIAEPTLKMSKEKDSSRVTGQKRSDDSRTILDEIWMNSLVYKDSHWVMKFHRQVSSFLSHLIFNDFFDDASF